MADDQNLTPTTPPTIPDAQSAMTPAPDFSVVPGHQQHAPAPQSNVKVNPESQYLKNLDTQRQGEQEYSDFLYKTQPDEYRKADPIGYFARKIHGVISDAAARGIEHEPEYLKQQVAPHIQEMADFVSGQAGVMPGSLGRTAGMAGAPLMPEGHFNMEDAASVQRMPEGAEAPQGLKSANPTPKPGLPARPEVGQPINFDAIAGHQAEPAPPMPSASAAEADHEIQRLSAVLRDPHASTLEKEVAHQQITDYREMFGRPEVPGSLGAVAGPPVKPAAETPEWQKQAVDTEIQRLEGGLRQPEVGQEERRVANQQLKDYRGETPDPKSVVESAGGVFRHSKNGLTEITLPPSMTDKLDLSPAMKKWVSVTIPDEEVTPENVKARMEQKLKDFGGTPEREPGEDEAPKIAPNEQVAGSAQRYNASRGQDQIDHSPVELPAPEERSRLADQFDRSKHEPNNPAVASAYDAMKKETLDQFNHAKNDLGVKFDFTKEDPYKTAEEMQADVRNNHHLATFTGGNPLPSDHPLAEVEPTTGQTYNDIFRATHDIFGHAAGGHDFSEGGEHSAYGAHNQMYSPEARPAVQNETQGQSNWYFNNEKVRNGAEPGEFPEQKATIIPDRGQTPEKSPNADIPENQQEATPETGYHPHLQAIADKHGLTESPYGVDNGASFITPDGKFIHLNSIEHGAAIHDVSGSSERAPFINESGAIRTKVSFDRGGKTLHISVPKGGVTNEQISALKQAAQKAVGKNGNIVLERADVTAETKDQLSKTKEFGNANDIEHMLMDIEAHPENKWHAVAARRADKQSAGGIDPRTGKSDTEGHGTEIYPEKRQALDHKPNAQDFQDFYAANKDFFDAHPALKIGWDNESNVPGGHELNIGAVGKGAKKVAKKLEQRAAFDIGKGEVIPTGGEGLRTEFPNYSLEDRVRDLNGEPLSDTPGFESLSKDFHANMEPDERAYLKDNNLLQSNAMSQYHKIEPSVAETTNAMQAGAALGGWWQRYIDVFHGLAGGGEQAAQKIGPSHAEVLKQWHAALSGNKSVQDANNLAWHSYADWLEAGKPTGRKEIDDIVRKNGAQPEGSGKKGNAAISDTRGPRGKLITPGLDTTKLFNLINSPEMKGQRPFSGNVFYPESGQIKDLTPDLLKKASAKGLETGPVSKGNLRDFSWISPDGKNFVNVPEAEDADIYETHNSIAQRLFGHKLDQTDDRAMNSMLEQGWVRKAEGGAYQVGKITPQTIEALEKTAIASGDFGQSLFVDVGQESSKGKPTKITSLEIPDGWKSISKELQKQGHQLDTEPTVGQNPLMGTTEGARKIPSMGATVAGKGNLNRLVIDAHIRNFYGHKASGGPAAQYIADSVHLRQAAKALGLKGGEGQEQLWGTVLGLKTLLKEGLTPQEASGKLNADVINQIGKDYAEVIANDPEIHGILDRLKQLGVGKGSAGLSSTNLPARSAGTSTGESGGGQAPTNQAELAKTASRIREQISPSKIKKPAVSKEKASGGWASLIAGTKPKYLPPK